MFMQIPIFIAKTNEMGLTGFVSPIKYGYSHIFFFCLFNNDTLTNAELANAETRAF